jgi:hypothetical protein
MDPVPVTPHALLWWQWLLAAGGCWTLAAFARYKLHSYLGGLAEPLAFISIAAGVFCILLGIVRYTGWLPVW